MVGQCGEGERTVGEAGSGCGCRSGSSEMLHACSLLAEAVVLVRGQMPYSNRSGGADHVFVASHDFGACFHPMVSSAPKLRLLDWLRSVDNEIVLWEPKTKEQSPGEGSIDILQKYPVPECDICEDGSICRWDEVDHPSMKN
ncbi:hypothetical protein E2562_039258 [Oryza meyeriana var. granulata]|uniref:Exostosin GT47 domain-containing protein n=1 Tax=Oryza meyeriana var. granulata TaxID=110450 RepID=A0A6G1BQH4_9ORYZ|nr:hypothetical protein E2562_039258 [Oryza meyeriana var. granulata]